MIRGAALDFESARTAAAVEVYRNAAQILIGVARCTCYAHGGDVGAGNVGIAGADMNRELSACRKAGLKSLIAAAGRVGEDRRDGQNEAQESENCANFINRYDWGCARVRKNVNRL